MISKCASTSGREGLPEGCSVMVDLKFVVFVEAQFRNHRNHRKFGQFLYLAVVVVVRYAFLATV